MTEPTAAAEQGMYAEHDIVEGVEVPLLTVWPRESGVPGFQGTDQGVVGRVWQPVPALPCSSACVNQCGELVPLSGFLMCLGSRLVLPQNSRAI